MDVGPFVLGAATSRCHARCGSSPFGACAVLLLFKGENNTNPFLPSLLVIRISRVLNENVDFTLGASF